MIAKRQLEAMRSVVRMQWRRRSYVLFALASADRRSEDVRTLSIVVPQPRSKLETICCNNPDSRPGPLSADHPGKLRGSNGFEPDPLRN